MLTGVIAVRRIATPNRRIFVRCRHGFAVRQGAARPFPVLPATLGRWTASLLPVDEEIYAYLAPDKLSVKAYQCDDGVVEVAAVYSRDWRSVHSPAACLTGGGWSPMDQRPRSIPIPGGVGVGQLPAEEMLVVRENKRRAALYTFLTPGEATHSWMRQCFRMAVSGRGRGGVLLLLTADVHDAPADTQELLSELLAELYVAFEWTGEAGEDG